MSRECTAIDFLLNVQQNETPFVQFFLNQGWPTLCQTKNTFRQTWIQIQLLFVSRYPDISSYYYYIVIKANNEIAGYIWLLSVPFLFHP